MHVLLEIESATLRDPIILAGEIDTLPLEQLRAAETKSNLQNTDQLHYVIKIYDNADCEELVFYQGDASPEILDTIDHIFIQLLKQKG